MTAYFQTVRVEGVKTESRASVTVEVNGQSRTFKDGEGVVFPRNMGGKQTSRVTGSTSPATACRSRTPGWTTTPAWIPKGQVVIYMGQAPSGLPPGSNRLVAARARNAIEKGAAAVIGPVPTFGGGRGGAAARRRPPGPAGR
jgi:hypothetical protein